jgi:WD40 repeat protein
VTAVADRLGTNPYVGPRAFTRGETLYGRDREVLDLIDLVVGERIVLLYSPSGAGKTSLLQAALIPALEQQDFVVPPVMRVGAELPGVLELSPRPNRYVLSALNLLETAVPVDDQRSPAELAALSFSDYLDHSYPPDQGHIVLVFDQLEEVMTLDPTDAAAKVEFFRQLGEALRDRRRWAVLTLREDFVAALDPYIKTFPAPLSRRYRLDLLGPDAALVALTAPAHAAGVTFDEAAATALVDDLRSVRVERWGETTVEPGPYVEPVQLQVAARQLWARRDPESRSIGVEDVTRLGDLDDALGEYYDEQVDVVAHGVDEQRAVRDWVDGTLITEQGFRSQAVGGPDGVENADRIVSHLVDSHLLRSESRRGTTWYELAHDRLVGPVRDRNATWRQAHLDPVELQAALWETEGRPDHRLLAGAELEEAKLWADSRSGDLSPAVRDFVDRSEGARRARSAGRYRRIGLIAGVLALIMASVAGVAGWLAKRASDDAAEATTRELISHATAQREKDPALSSLLALEAFERDPGSLDAVAALDGAVNAEESLSATQIVFSSRPMNLAVAYAPDGRTIATGGNDGTAIIWDAASGQPLRTLIGHTDWVRAIAYAPDSRTLATASDDTTGIIWDVATGDQLTPLEGHTSWVNGIAYAPDGETLATASNDSTAIIWDTATGTQLTRLQGHTDFLNAIAYAPDGQTLATASNDSTAIIWDTATGQPLHTLTGHTDWVRSVAYAPNGQTLATASDDRSVMIWDAATGQPLIPLGQATQGVGSAFAVSGDRGHLAIATDTAAIHDVAQEAPGRELDIEEGAITDLAFTAGDESVVSGDDRGAVRLWRAVTGTESRTLLDGDAAITAVATSRDGRLIAAATASSADVEVIDLDEDGARWQISDIEADVVDLAFEPDGAVLAVAQADGTVSLWDAVDRRSIGDVGRVDDASVTELATGGSAQSWRVAAAYDDGTVVVANVTDEEVASEPVELTIDDVPVDLAFNASGREVAVLTANGVGVASTETDWQLEPLDGEFCSTPSSPIGIDYVGRAMVAVAAQDGSVQTCETAPSATTVEATAVYAVAVDPEGERVVSGDDAGGVIPWDLGDSPSPGRPFGSTAEGDPGGALSPGAAYGTSDEGDLGETVSPDTVDESADDGHQSYVNDVDYSPDGTRVASAGGDRRGAIWDVEDEGADPTWLVGHEDAVLGIDFSPDGSLVATASKDGTIGIWDAATGTPLPRFPGHEGGVWDVAFSPRDDVLVSVGEDEVVRLWDADSGDALGALPRGSGHTDLVFSVVFDPDGEKLATTGADGTTIIWDVDDREVIYQFDDHNGPVLSAAFHPTEELVATASDDRTVLLYDLSTGDLERRIELPSAAYSVAFTPDGEDIVIGTGAGQIVVDPLDTDELVERAEERAGRELTADECEQFLHNPDCAADADNGY